MTTLLCQRCNAAPALYHEVVDGEYVRVCADCLTQPRPAA